MTSLSGVVLATDAPSTSEPESLDSLDFDDWEGQFEFVGNNNNNKTAINGTSASASTTGTSTTTTDSNANELEDLNLSVPHFDTTITTRPILIDEETFLSLQLNDPDSLKYDRNLDRNYNDTTQTAQTFFIENALKHLHFDQTNSTIVPLPSTNDLNEKSTRLTHHSNEMIQTKNRLNQNHRNQYCGDRNNNQYDVRMNNNHHFSNDLCDSLLKEQVSVGFS